MIWRLKVWGGGLIWDPGQGRVGLETEGDDVRDVHVIFFKNPSSPNQINKDIKWFENVTKDEAN